MKKIFQVTKIETSSCVLFVEAETAEQAEEYALQTDGPGWTENQDLETETNADEITDPATLKGNIINRTDKTYFYADRPHERLS